MIYDLNGPKHVIENAILRLASLTQKFPRVPRCIVCFWDAVGTWRLGDLAVELRERLACSRSLNEDNDVVRLPAGREQRELGAALLDRERPQKRRRGGSRGDLTPGWARRLVDAVERDDFAGCQVAHGFAHRVANYGFGADHGDQ